MPVTTPHLFPVYSQETMELQFKQSKAVAVTALAFPQAEVNNFILGSEEGNVYTGDCQSNQHYIYPRDIWIHLQF